MTNNATGTVTSDAVIGLQHLGPGFAIANDLPSSYDDVKGETEHVDGDLKSAPGSGAPDFMDPHADPFADLTIWQTWRKFWKTFLIATMISVGAMFDSYALSMPSNIIVNPGFIKTFGRLHMPDGTVILDPKVLSMWGSVGNASQIFGYILCPFIMDRLGRKANLWTIVVFVLGAFFVEIFTTSPEVFTLSKFLGFAAIGLAQAGLVAYIAEIAPTKLRGSFLTCYSLWFGIGQLLGSVVLEILMQVAPMNYKGAFYAEMVILAMFLPGLIYAPESPYWLAKMGKKEKAIRSMKRLYGNIKEYNYEHEYERIVKQIERYTADASSDPLWRQYLDLFRGPNLKRTLVSCMPLLLQQLSGIAIFFGYMSYFFALAGLENPFQSTIIQSCISLFAMIVAIFVVDRVPRRVLLLSGAVVMGAANLGIGGLYYKAPLNGQALVALACIWTFTFGLTAGPVGWAMLGEISTAKFRAKGSSVAAMMVAVVGLVWNYTIPLMLSPAAAGWGIRTCFLWAGLLFPYAIALYFCVPETRGRSPQALDWLFENKIPMRKFGSAAVPAGL